jgi:hypothetical protein
MSSIWRAIGLCVLLLTAAEACASKLRPRRDEMPVGDAGNVDAGEPSPFDGPDATHSGKFKSLPQSDGSTLSVVDATDDKQWQQFDFDTGKEATGERDWDIALLRFKIRTNGGIAGPGGVYVAQLEGQSYDDLTKAPDMGFAGDRPDSVGDAGDTDPDPDNVFNSGADDWYDYNVKTHELSPKDITYVIASTEKQFFKFRIEKYYDKAGTPAQLQFRWKQIEAPDAGLPRGDGGLEADGQ